MAGELMARIEEAVAHIRARSGVHPDTGIVLGTGLGDFTDGLEVETVVPYREIPHFPHSTVESHAGELHLGRIAGHPVAVMKGRVHYYEGYRMEQVAFPVRVLKALGCGTVIITNAVGGMNPTMPAGTLVVTRDHINLMGDNPLIGENDDRLGPRFPDMSEPYACDLIELAERAAQRLGIPLQRAVFVGVPGPNLETPAEYRFLRAIGADVVGMSLVPEVIAAVHGGQRVLSFNVVTDTCDPDHLEPVSIPAILAVAARVAPVLMRLVTEVVRHIEEASKPRLSPAENR